MHRFRGRCLPGKALNNQGGIYIGSTPGISNDGAVVRYTKLKYNILIKKVSDRTGQVTRQRSFFPVFKVSKVKYSRNKIGFSNQGSF